MLERTLLTFLIFMLGAAVFLLFRAYHKRRASQWPLPLPAERGKPMLLYFRSDHCSPCITQAHYLRALEQSYPGRLAIRAIDVEREVDLAVQYGIVTLPSTLLVDPNGEVQHINYGLTGATKLAQQLEKVL